MNYPQQAPFFNALAIASFGDYRKLDRYYKKHGGDWAAAWNSEPRTITPEHAWRQLEKTGVKLALREDEDFPASLREIPLAPFGLYIKEGAGEHSALRCDRSVAIVGTRKASGSGEQLAHEFSTAAVGASLTVVSGLALGIDAAAHRGAIEAGGQTVAVMACGLDDVYPKHHAQLAENILAAGGQLVSEYPLGAPALPRRFLERNRIINGLCAATLVIEAPERSGSLATARFALEQNREVLVVPGSAKHINYKGSHRLIRAGAQLVVEPQHMLEVLGSQDENDRSLVESAEPEERTIIDLLRASNGALTIDKIAQLTKLDIRVVNEAVMLLTIRDAVKETARGYTI